MYACEGICEVARKLTGACLKLNNNEGFEATHEIPLADPFPLQILADRDDGLYDLDCKQGA